MDHFTVRLNGHPIPLQWTPAGAAHHFVGFIPRQLISQSRGSTVLTLKTSSVASPAELQSRSDGHRGEMPGHLIDRLPSAVAAEPLDAPARRRMPVSDQPISSCRRPFAARLDFVAVQFMKPVGQAHWSWATRGGGPCKPSSHENQWGKPTGVGLWSVAGQNSVPYLADIDRRTCRSVLEILIISRAWLSAFAYSSARMARRAGLLS